MVEFSTILVLDLETTSLPSFDYNTTKITELALVGCEVKYLKSSTTLPRVLQKLLLLFNPNKKIDPKASETSGLDNELLENMKPFTKEDGDMLKQFISRLPPPVCIVAHNGSKFDFPILRRALDILKIEFGDNVYCADSLTAFKEIYPRPIKFAKKRLTTKEEVRVEAVDPEKTPSNKKTTPSNILNYKRQSSSGVKRTLLDDEEFKNEISGTPAESSLPYPVNYKLKSVYHFLHEKNFEDAHRAECDCLALLECIIRCEKFLNWISDHSEIFDSVPPLS